MLLSGWGGLVERDLPETVIRISEAPHDWLFPRTSAVVHHGGAGTTAAGLRAGRPTVVVPFFGDQPFWGARVHALGAGPRPLPQRSLTAERLGDAMLRAIEDRKILDRAASLGERLRQESGAARAAEIANRYLRGVA